MCAQQWGFDVTLKRMTRLHGPEDGIGQLPRLDNSSHRLVCRYSMCRVGKGGVGAFFFRVGWYHRTTQTQVLGVGNCDMDGGGSVTYRNDI